MQSVKVSQLTFGSLLKLFFVPAAALYLLVGVLIALAALLGADTVTWNDKPVYGLSGALLGLTITVLVGGIFGGLGALFSAGLVKLLSGVLPIGRIQIKDS